MAAIVRVKRRRDEDPAESLLIRCKRAKFSGDENEEVKTVFKFAGTVNAKGNEVATQFVQQAIRTEKLKKEYKCHAIDRDARYKAERTRITSSGRCKIVGKKRAIDFQGLRFEDDCAEAIEAKKQFLLYDVEKESKASDPSVIDTSEVMCNGMAMVRSKTAPGSSAVVPSSEQFLYDLYYMNTTDFDYRMLENVLAVELTRQEYICDADEGENEDRGDTDDDEDKETNWRNDYPDEDPLYYETMDYEYQTGIDGKMLGDDFIDDFEGHITLGDQSSEDETDGNDAEILAAEVEQFSHTSSEKWKSLNDFYKKKLNS